MHACINIRLELSVRLVVVESSGKKGERTCGLRFIYLSYLLLFFAK